MKKSYIETMARIYPTEEQKIRMLDKIFEADPVKKSHRIKFRYFAAAIAACILFSTTAVFAEELKNTFYNLLGKNEIVSEKVLNDVYSDTDGHVTMTVKEALSDTINSCVIVEYETHDEKAMEWLDKYTSLRQKGINRQLLMVTPSIKEGTPGPSLGYDWEELTEYRTENTRVFKAISDASSDECALDTIDLEYRLFNKYENHAVINVSKSVELTDIKIDSSIAPDKRYKPLGVKISPMTFFIYGQNCGLYESGINKYGSYYIQSLSDEEIESLYLVMKDGKKYDLLKENDLGLDGGWMLCSAGQFSDTDYDVSIYCAAAQSYIDIKNIEGFELDGVYYSLSEYIQ